MNRRNPLPPRAPAFAATRVRSMHSGMGERAAADDDAIAVGRFPAVCERPGLRRVRIARQLRVDLVRTGLQAGFTSATAIA